jgi:SAM-dependent methyltransferase
MTERPDEFVDELADPVAALPSHFGVDVPYDPRSRRALVGPVLTLARRGLIGMLSWWLRTALERQDHVNRLVARALEQLRRGSNAGLDARLAQVEAALRARESADKLQELEREALAQTLISELPLTREDVTAIVRRLGAGAGRRVLVLGAGSSGLVDALVAAHAAVTFVDTDANAVADARTRGADAKQLSLDVYLQSVPDATFDGAVSATVATKTPLHHLPVVLRQIARALRPEATLVLVAPDPRSLAMLQERLWRDPSAARPIPSALLADVVRFAGFAEMDVIAVGERPRGLTEDGDEARRANIRLLNETLFGAPAYALVARVRDAAKRASSPTP